MPRDVEHTANCHNAATELRKAGKPVWARRVRIKHLLNDGDSDDNAKAVGAAIADVLKKSSWSSENPEVEMIAEEFEDIEGLHHFNLVMDGLYDEADYGRVWIE